MENLISKMEVSKNMKAARLSARYTQPQVAKALGTTKQTISNWETDPGKVTFDKFRKLAELYGVTVSYFFGL